MKPDIEFDTTIMDGITVTIQAWIQPAEPDVDIKTAYIEDWEVTSSNKDVPLPAFVMKQVEEDMDVKAEIESEIWAAIRARREV